MYEEPDKWLAKHQNEVMLQGRNLELFKRESYMLEGKCPDCSQKFQVDLTEHVKDLKKKGFHQFFIPPHQCKGSKDTGVPSGPSVHVVWRRKWRSLEALEKELGKLPRADGTPMREVATDSRTRAQFFSSS
jgi:hypothetical protein